MAAPWYIGLHCALPQPSTHHFPPHLSITYQLEMMDTACPLTSHDHGMKYHTAEKAKVMLDTVDVASEEEELGEELDTAVKENEEIVESNEGENETDSSNEGAKYFTI